MKFRINLTPDTFTHELSLSLQTQLASQLLKATQREAFRINRAQRAINDAAHALGEWKDLERDLTA